jgi:hypothetical protein
MALAPDQSNLPRMRYLFITWLAFWILLLVWSFTIRVDTSHAAVPAEGDVGGPWTSWLEVLPLASRSRHRHGPVEEDVSVYCADTSGGLLKKKRSPSRRQVKVQEDCGPNQPMKWTIDTTP